MRQAVESTDRPVRPDKVRRGGLALTRTPSRRARLIAPWVTLVVLALAWHFGAQFTDALLIPGFLDTVVAFVSLFGETEVWGALFVSLQALVLGFALSILIGIPVGLLLGRYRVPDRLANPYIDVLLVLPMAAVIPLLVMSIGIGLWSRVLLIVMFAIPMVIVNTQVGVKQINPALIEMARSFGASEGQVWSQVLFRAASPAIMTGVRIGLGRAINGMIIAELLMVAVGLGELIMNARGSFNPARLYAVVILTLVLASGLISLARYIERKLVPWSS